MDLKKIADNPLVPLICLLDVLYNWVQRIISVIQDKPHSSDMFSATNWFDILVRLVLAYLIWDLFRMFRNHQSRIKKEMSRQNAATIEAIRVVLKLSDNADRVLIDLWKESRDRSGQNIEYIVKALTQLGYKGMGINEEHPEVSKYKGKANDLLDEQEAPLLEIIDNWEENTKIN